MTLGERVRWRVARWLDGRGGWCWPKLVGWAMYGSWSEQLRGCRIDRICRDDAARCGVCYCGRSLAECVETMRGDE